MSYNAKVSPPEGSSTNLKQARDIGNLKQGQTSKGGKPKKQKWEVLDWRTPRNTAPGTNYRHWQRPSGSSLSAAAAKQWNSRGKTTATSDSPTARHVREAEDILSAMEKVSLEPTKKTAPREPLTEFHLFPDLPAELRCKIWALGFTPRILEVERNYDKAIAEERHGAHNYWQISRKSSEALPPVLLACRESREEGLRTCQQYDLTDKDINDSGPPAKLTYFNPSFDIIYFGEGTCMETVVHFFWNCHRKGYDITRVAILCTGQITNCHKFEDDPLYGPDEYECALGHTIAGGCTLMQALHGIDQEIAWNQLVPGCKGLREVFWIVKSNLMPVKVGEIHDKVSLRPSVGNGLTAGQKSLKAKIEEDIQRVESGDGLERVGENKWVGISKPTFRFMSLAPTPEKDKVYDSVIVQARDLNKLTNRGYDYVKDVEKWSGCRLQLCGKDYPTQKEVELGFYGTQSEIAYAKKKIENKLRFRGRGNNRRQD